MATIQFPSSYRCDCGHQVDFGENTVREMAELSHKRSKPQTIGDLKDENNTPLSDHYAIALDFTLSKS